MLWEKIKKINGLSAILYLAVLTPFAYAGCFLYPAVFTPNSYFRLIVSAGVLIYLWQIRQGKAAVPKVSLIFAGFAVFFAAAFLASAVNPGFYLSFFDGFERMEGLINYVYLFLFFIIVAAALPNKTDWEKILRWALLINFLMAGYALLQHLPFDFLVGSGGARATGLLGNPAFLASYLTFGVFFSLWILAKSKNAFDKIIYAAVVVINLAAVYFTKTRGAWLGLFIGVIIYAFILLWQKNKKIALLFCLLVLFAGAAGFFRFRTDLKEKVYQTTSIQNRLIAWQVSFRAFKEKPILGWGAGNFDVAFNKYYDPTIKNELFFDHAHNVFLDLAVKFGAVGLLCYVFFIGAIFWEIISASRREKITKSESTVFTGLIFAYLIQNFFLFDAINALLLFFLVAGYLQNIAEPLPGINGFWPQRKVNYAAFGLGALIIYAVFFYNLKPAAANFFLSRAWRAGNVDAYAAAGYFKKAKNLRTLGEFELAKRVAQMAVESKQNPKFNIMTINELYQLAAEANEELNSRYPEKIRPKINLAALYIEASDDLEKTLPQAEKILQEAIVLAPKKQELYDLLAERYLAGKNWQKALEQINKLISLGYESADFYFKKGLLEIYLNEIKAGEDSLQRAQAMGKKMNFVEAVNLALSYENNKEWQKAIDGYLLSLTITERRADAGVNFVNRKLYNLYQKIGNLERAKFFEAKFQVNKKIK